MLKLNRINYLIKPLCLLIAIFSLESSFALNHVKPSFGTHAFSVSEINDFNQYPSNVKKIITSAATLSTKDLTYKYGSADPKNSGMDCSGTMYYLLHQYINVYIPRSAHGMYEWSKKSGHFYTVSNLGAKSHGFEYLKPGDLLFWSGTYAIKNKSDISHVMLYLGKDKQGKELMFGASNGRTYRNQKMWGVSVFDFSREQPGNGTFVGYSCIPAFTC